MGTFLLTYWFEVVLFVLAAVPSIIFFTIKGRISHWFAKDLENHKAELNRTSDQLCEKLRIEYDSLYHKRIAAIEQIYRKLAMLKQLEYEIDDQHARWQSDDDFQYIGTKNMKKLVDSLIQTLIDVEIEFIKSKLYFSEKDNNLVIPIITLGRNFSSSYAYFNEHEQGYEDNNGVVCSIEHFVERYFTSLFGKELNESLLTVENRYRQLVGVKDTE